MAHVIPETWSVPPRIRQRIGAQAGRQRAMVEDGHLLLILHDIPKPGDPERTSRIFWRSSGGDWKATGGQGNGLAALKRHLENFQAAIHELDEKVDKTHRNLSHGADELYEVLRAITPINRTVRHMHKAMQEAREGVDDKEIISMRDLTNDLERATELVVADAKNALEYTEAKAAAEQAVFAKKTVDAQHRLNLLAALFFPVTAVASVLGTEMSTGFEKAGPAVFWVIIAASIALGFFIRSSLSK
jgi:Mg2+ and Co2+ transporter CorA